MSLLEKPLYVLAFPEGDDEESDVLDDGAVVTVRAFDIVDANRLLIECEVQGVKCLVWVSIRPGAFFENFEDANRALEKIHLEKQEAANNE